LEQHQAFLIACINPSHAKGHRTISQRRGLLMFIPKKDKSLCNIKNWQPISLVNCDFKIVAKSIDNRITRSLSSTITSDKTGFQKTWFISKNITLRYGISRPTERYCRKHSSTNPTYLFNNT